MKKWYFSENGSVSGPYSMSEANTLLKKNNDVYGWNPTFSQWLPVTQIPEFSELIPDSKPAAQVPKELIDRFVTKKRDLNKKIKLIDETIKNSEEHIKLFDNEINQYKSLTESLSDDVKNNIVPLEKKHQLVIKQLLELKKAAEIAKHEIIDVVQEFGDLVLSKANESEAGLSELKELPELKSETSKRINSEHAGSVNSTTSIKARTKSYNAPKNVEPTETLNVVAQKKVQINSKEIESDTSTSEHSQEKTSVNEENSEQNAFSGVKNKFKSVFKPKVEEPTIKLSDKLKQLEQPPKEVVTQDATQGVNDDELIEDSEEQKTTRRRRRRF